MKYETLEDAVAELNRRSDLVWEFCGNCEVVGVTECKDCPLADAANRQAPLTGSES